MFLVSITLELLHYLIPNRAFELRDLYANGFGVILAYLMLKIFKKILKIILDVTEKEILMMGLRLNEGVDLKKLKHITFLYNDEVLELQKQCIINVKKKQK